MKKIKMFAAAAMFCAAAFAGYTAYEQATMTEKEKMFQANLEALADDSDETDSSDERVGYIDDPQECTISETVTEKLCFDINLGYWSVSCEWEYDDVQEYAGTQNYCKYTGGDSSCKYHTCQRN